jgi:rhamnulokinase
MLRRFGLPARIFPKVVPPGTRLGKLRPSVAEATGLAGVEVVAPPTHDTASAVAGVPTAYTGHADWAYISSGTWSLMGAEVQTASLSKRTLELNMTNEGGLDGTYRLLKNIMGLWLIQQCKRSFDAKGKSYGYGELSELARQARPLRSIVDPDDTRFLNPREMPKAIQDFCRETQQPVPETEGELIRCATESLALKYRVVLDWLEELTGENTNVIHIVGGGSQNTLLDQMTADSCRRPVVTGPVEATALGNLLVQVRASGELRSLSEMRDVIRASSDVARFEPSGAVEWQAASERFAALQKKA